MVIQPSLWRTTLAVAFAATAACAPEIEEQPWLVTTPRVLAVQFFPAEARPGQSVSAKALVASSAPQGEEAALQWRVCGQRKQVSELGPIEPACLEPGSPVASLIGTGPAAALEVPRESCQVFGPDRAPALEGQPPGRPVDPDPTGGYFLPWIVGGLPESALGEMRLRCGLAAAPSEEARRFQAGNPLNVNPLVAAVAVGTPTGPSLLTSLEANPTSSVIIPAGTSAQLYVAWPACNDGAVCGDSTCGLQETAATCAADCANPTGCAGAEYYLWFNPELRELLVKREALQSSWFATGGSFALPRTSPENGLNQSSNVFTAPSVPGEHRLWVVLRDDRGGVSWASFRVVVP